MNQDVEADDQAKPPIKQEKVEIDFVSAISDRQLGFTKKPFLSSAQINSTAEDELVKKQFRELHCELPGVTRSTFLMEFSPDGTKVASTHGNHQIYVTDVRSGKHIKTLVGHPRTPWCIAFHPTSNQIIASGCLGGQVRIWDLSGGSEVWTTSPPSVIASIAFHPSDRLLAIATYNLLYFWDWSSPGPFMNVSTSRTKEKVRYVAFDKLGHKLITGITNTPQTRWERLERVRAVPVSVSVPVVRFNSLPSARAPAPVISIQPTPAASANTNQQLTTDLLSRLPEHEQRITSCYRDLVHQYELLVHRYLQIYRRPIMIDQGTDPMEIESNQASASAASTTSSATQNQRPDSPIPSTSGIQKRQVNTVYKDKSPLLFPSSDSSNSSSIEDVRTAGKSSGGTQTSNNHDRSTSPQPSTSTSNNGAKFPKLFTSSSSSDEDDDDDIQNKPRRVSESSSNRPTPSTAPRKFTKARQLNLSRQRKTAFKSNESANTDTQEEPKVKMRLRWFMQATKEKTGTTKKEPVNNDASQPSTSAASNNNNGVDRRDHLNNLNKMLNNAKLMLASLQKVTPTTSTTEPGPSSKPSKATNTTEADSTPRRKRRHVRPQLLGNMLFTSTDESSSDVEGRAEHSSEQTDNPSNADVESVSTVAEASSFNEHPTSELSATSKVKRRRLRAVEDVNEIGSESESATNSQEPSSSHTTRNQSSQSGELMDRRTQQLVIESLSVLEQPSTSTENVRITSPLMASLSRSSNEGNDTRRNCATCGGRLVDSTENPNNTDGCARTATICTRLHIPRMSTSTSTNLPPTTPPLDRPWRRFLSRRLAIRERDRDGSRPAVSPSSFAQDELINFSERDAEEYLSNNSESSTRIGNMYSTIVQELESSLHDVLNIRFRLGEMSHILGNFSNRLQNIMTQSNTILRNLSTSLEELPINGGTDQAAIETPSASSRPISSQTSTTPETPPYLIDELLMSTPPWNIRTSRLSLSNNPINSDHTYPLNPEATQGSPPLYLSPQLTLLHIQRQARLLRQQVESIERIDAHMIETQQVQSMRQIFNELYTHFNANSSESRSGLSSVRQMMAGTRISDSSPYDSPSDDNTSSTASTNASTSTLNNNEPQPSTSRTGNTSESTSASNSSRTRTRKNVPRCLYLMRRHFRRGDSNILNARRSAAKDRVLLRRNIYRRFLPSRTSMELSTLRSRGYLNLFNPDTIRTMIRRVEHLLLEHSLYIGRTPPTHTGNTSRNDEHQITLRVRNCRLRMNSVMGVLFQDDVRFTNVTNGETRYATRQSLSLILDNLICFIEVNRNLNIYSSFRAQICELIKRAVLLSEILLLQIIDSVPPSSGVNMDQDLEQLRLVGQSNQLTRSLRLMRMTVRNANRALGQTYTARRNALLASLSDNESTDSRQQLLDSINTSLQNIERHRLREGALGRFPGEPNQPYTAINTLISMYISNNTTGSTASTLRPAPFPHNSLLNINTASYSDEPTPSTSSQQSASATTDTIFNIETGETIPRPTVTVEDANSSDDNTNNDSIFNIRPSRIGLYQPNRSQEDNDEDRVWRSPNFLNVPTVHVNDVPVPDTQQMTWRNRSSRLRLTERLDELRNVGLLRPRFLHPLYSGVVNPFAFEDNLDDAHREIIYDSDVIPTVTPNHRIQVWDFLQEIPNISNPQKNLVVKECKIHNDASVDCASDGSILVTLLPYGGYVNVTNRLGVFSLEWETLGQCLYVASFEQNAVSVSLSPTNRHLVVGLASRRVSIVPTDTWTIARIFLLEDRKAPHGILSPIRELEQNRDTNYMSVNCIRWLPTAGQGLIFGTNTGHLRLLS